ncbi:MAG TPA: valine--tRNA ligase [Chloroflexi bacterium]|nr:valine--tRNA ligase [Chloroflexota bacterium]
MAMTNLPKTYDPQATEERLYRWWENKGFFTPTIDWDEEPFVISMPPPNVTGGLHMGHAMFVTLEDIMTRYHRMKGEPTLWLPGTDHAGIATQLLVERMIWEQEGKRRQEVGREEFVARVWEWKERYGGYITRQLRRLGASCDWTRERFTLDPLLSRAVVEVFVRLYEKGLIYRGTYLINWSPNLQTAVSDLEVEYSTEPGTLYFFKYRLADNPNEYIPVATTRPETILGDTAVAVHPADERYQRFIGRTALVPILDRSVPVIPDEYVEREFGTGALKITPGHDPNDYEIGQRHNLPIINIMNKDATLNENGGPYAGRDRFEARKRLWADMEAAGLTLKTQPHELNVPRSQRGGEIIEPLVSTQWFVKIGPLAEPAIAAVREGCIEIIPERFEKVYFNWMENIRDWCISRQLWWGHQIPVWYGPSVDENGAAADMPGQQFCAPTEEEALSLATKYYEEKLGADVDVNIQRVEDTADGRKEPLPTAGGGGFGAGPFPLSIVNIARDPDVLDTWFSSGLWPIGTLGWPEDTPELKKYFPTSVLITGFDIIFFWVARMMMMQFAVVGQRPFDHVYVHALVRDEKGKKMSKSLGNVLDPLELIDEYGADAVRFTLTAMAAMGRDLKLSTQRIAGYRNFGTKLWNAARFAEMHGATGSDGRIPPADITVNRWIIGETARVREIVDLSLAEFRFNEAANALYAFVWGKVCDWYVEFSKPLLMDGTETERAETRATMAWVIDQCVILLHPIMPFITEELWQTLGQRDKMLVHADWPDYGAALIDADADREINWVIALIEAIRSARAQVNVPAGLQVPIIVTDLDAAGEDAWRHNEAMIKRLARIDSLARSDSLPRGAITIPVEGGVFALPVADLIDVAAEKTRLEKAVSRLEKEITGLRKRLDNPKFAESAPADVVEETRANLHAREAEEAKLRDALSRLAELV